MMNPYGHFISETTRILEAAKSYQLGGVSPTPRTEIPTSAPKVLIFSPHPDDECIIGALPLRLLREIGMRVINVAVTLGSRKDRRQERLTELTDACNYLGFELLRTQEGGLEKINLQTRKQELQLWRRAVDVISEILEAKSPNVIFFPHSEDRNSTHIGTHYLVVDALSQMGGDISCQIIETEYWHPMTTPNLLVESSQSDVVDLVTALSFHVGEVRRNPYHLRLPSWMIDNVRRGGETVGQQGSEVPDFIFATIYRHRRWQGEGLVDDSQLGKYLPVSADLSDFRRGAIITPRT
jgi:N-acetylglucosamine malate deacetylase 1